MAVASPSRPRDLWLKALAGSQERRARAAKVAQDRALAAALPRMAKRVSKAFVALERSAVHGPEVKAAADKVYPLTYTVPSYDEFQNALRQILTQEYINVGSIALGNAERQLGIELAFDLNERIIPKGVIARRVTGVTDMTRVAINKTIRQGIDDGVHPSVIAKRMRDQLRGYAGLEDLTKSRAYTIARTETANAYNLGAIAGYRGSGIVRQVRCIDSPSCGWSSHNDPDTANGKVVTLDQASAQPISHPNCVRAWAPVAAGLEEKLPEPAADLYANPKDFETAGYGYPGAPGGLQEWGHGIYDAIDKALITQDMKDALANYSGSGYRYMNNHLRGTDVVSEPFGLARIAALEKYIGLARTPDAVRVFRGVGQGRAFGLSGYMETLEREKILNGLIGTGHTEAGFMSTALAKKAAFGGVKLHLTVPKGYKALPVSYESTHFGGSGPNMGESELLLRPGTRYVIDSWERDGVRGNVILNGHVLP